MNMREHAILYAAQKLLERTLKNETFPHNSSLDVSHQSITITFNRNTVVERDGGINGDGIIEKTATQNLYGYAIIAALARRLKKFHQWNILRNEILEAVRDALKHGNTLENEFLKDKEFAAQLEDIRATVQVTPRKEPTPRKVNAELPPKFTFKF